MTEELSQTCQTCKFWQLSHWGADQWDSGDNMPDGNGLKYGKGPVYGECRKRAPTSATVAHMPDAIWAVTHRCDNCGEYETRQRKEADDA